MLLNGWMHARRSFANSRWRFNMRTSVGSLLLQPCRRKRGQSFGGRSRSMMTYEMQMSQSLTAAAATRCLCTTLSRYALQAFASLPRPLTQSRRQESSRFLTHAVAGGPRASQPQCSRGSRVPSGKPAASRLLVPELTGIRHLQARNGAVGSRHVSRGGAQARARAR